MKNLIPEAPVSTDAKAAFGPGLDDIGFTAGTLIMTATGERPVEDLTVGDRLMTKDFGVQAVKSISLRTVDLSQHPDLRPILIEGNAFGALSPSLPIYASPMQRIALRHPLFDVFFGAQEVLAPSGYLVGHKGVQFVEAIEAVSYIFLGFAQHQLLYVENLAVDTGARDASTRRPVLTQDEVRVALGVLSHRPTSSPLPRLDLH